VNIFMAFDLIALRNKLMSRVRFCTDIYHKCCSYWVSIVDTYVAMYIFMFVLGVNCRHLCCNVHFYVRTGCQLSTLMLQCTFLCSYRVSIVDTYVAMYIFIHPSPRSVQHKMQVLQNLEENGRHACRGQHCSLQFCPRKFTGRLIPLRTIFLRVIFLNFRLPTRIGAECGQVCAETMTGCGDLFARGSTKCRDGPACR